MYFIDYITRIGNAIQALGHSVLQANTLSMGSWPSKMANFWPLDSTVVLSVCPIVIGYLIAPSRSFLLTFKSMGGTQSLERGKMAYF